MNIFKMYSLAATASRCGPAHQCNAYAHLMTQHRRFKQEGGKGKNALLILYCPVFIDIRSTQKGATVFFLLLFVNFI